MDYVEDNKGAEGETVSVSFGFIPQSNASVAITAFTVTDVTVPAN